MFLLRQMSLEVLPPASEECINGVRAEYNLDQIKVQQALEAIKYWLKRQPHLPSDEGKLLFIG